MAQRVVGRLERELDLRPEVLRPGHVGRRDADAHDLGAADPAPAERSAGSGTAARGPVERVRLIPASTSMSGSVAG